MGTIDNLIGEDFTPDPVSLLESTRNLGYSIEEAISDLIDNSITAKAKNISYEFHWNKGRAFFLLKDDGNGMSNKNNELIDSFKLGSDKEKVRDIKDLGRFGFGMKTASLSQARSLTVITKKKGFSILARALDLNFISTLNQGWKLKNTSLDSFPIEVEFLNNIDSGTIIRWDDWDRAPNDENDFLSLVENINNYLSVCFHRFLEKGVKIFCHDIALLPFSPIPSGDGATKYSEIIINDGAKQTAYILQHPKFWQENYETIFRFNSFRLFEGLERQQGIYIYRGDRLLTPKAGWLGQLYKGNSAKLARVVIDYKNTEDSLWSLDITKTNATIPFEFKSAIRQLIDAAKNASLTKIIRGTRSITQGLRSTNNSLIWKSANDIQYNAYRYFVDINHPIFQFYISENIITEKKLNILLDIISNNLPISHIIQNNDEDPSKHDRMYKKESLSAEEISQAKIIYNFQCTKMTRAVAFSWLLGFEPYCYYETQLNKELNDK